MTSKVRNIALPVILTVLFVRTIAMAAESTSAPEEKKKKSFLILPIVSYAPETRWAGGLAGGLTFLAHPDWTLRTMVLYDFHMKDTRLVFQVYFYKGIRF